MSPTNLPPVPHYHRGQIQLIEYLEGSLPREQYIGYLRGQVVKYLSRFDHKGTPEADLIKAAQYLEWLREAVARKSVEEAMNR